MALGFKFLLKISPPPGEVFLFFSYLVWNQADGNCSNENNKEDRSDCNNIIFLHIIFSQVCLSLRPPRFHLYDWRANSTIYVSRVGTKKETIKLHPGSLIHSSSSDCVILHGDLCIRLYRVVQKGCDKFAWNWHRGHTVVVVVINFNTVWRRRDVTMWHFSFSYF